MENQQIPPYMTRREYLLIVTAERMKFGMIESIGGAVGVLLFGMFFNYWVGIIGFLITFGFLIRQAIRFSKTNTLFNNTLLSTLLKNEEGGELKTIEQWDVVYNVIGDRR